MCFFLVKTTVVSLNNNLNFFKLFLHLFFIPFFYIIYAFNCLLFENIDLFLNYYFQKKKWNFIKLNKFFFFLDLIYFYTISNVYKNSRYINFNLRIKVRLKQVNWFFYKDTYLNSLLWFNLIHYLSGIKYIWKSIKYWLLSLILGLIVFYYLTYIKLLPFSKICLGWLLITMFAYWLLSGFIFFIKKYQYSKFTSVVQRFWKRSYILFWVIETGVFLIFFFLLLNAAEEPVYMYDQIKLFKTHLFSWRLFLLKLVPAVSLVILSYFLILNIKWTSFSKQVPIIIVITLIFIYIFWLEFYQFFHIINWFENLNWVFDIEKYIWILNSEYKRTRINNNVLAVCLLAKFWHLVIIFLFWVFFVLRVNEVNRIRFPLLSANGQNFIILYILSWLYMYPWLKFSFRRYLEIPYFWYFYNGRHLNNYIFFNDFILFILSIFNNKFNWLFNFDVGLFYYWMESSIENNLLQYKKHIIRDYIVNSINNINNNNLFFIL